MRPALTIRLPSNQRFLNGEVNARTENPLPNRIDRLHAQQAVATGVDLLARVCRHRADHGRSPRVTHWADLRHMYSPR